MKAKGRAVTAALFFLMGGPLAWGQRREEPREWERHAPRRMVRPAPAVINKQRRVVVPQPRSIPRPQNIPHDNRRIAFPRRDASGAAIVRPPARVPPSQHAAVVRNGAFVRDIRAQQRVEVVPNQRFWHTDRGIRYCHVFDGRVHWYGFYHGPAFYWTRFYDDRWWWFDARFGGRWLYWWDGFWWWPAPGGVMYVYVDNDYYPYDSAGVTVVNPEIEEAPEEIPPPSAGSSYLSPDGRRMVQILGDGGEAYLYDHTGSVPAYLRFLGRGAEKARFSGGSGGAPLRILIEFRDGGFALYDANGDPENAGSSTAPAAAPSPAGPPPDVPMAAPGE